MKTNTLKLTAGLTAAMVFSAGAVFGQEPGEDDVIILDEVAAEDIPIEESILATTRPISSVYGSDRSILDTPRNVNIVSREQLDAISIKDVRDFSKLTSSSYTKTNFGAPTTPNLRGQEADLMINGMRRGLSTNGNGVPINFNSVESVNIIKGPAGAVYGTSNYVGGYADLVTKRAYFDNGGKASYSIASYDQHTVTLDQNLKLSDTLAFRASAELKEWNEGFWDNYYQKSQSVYATIAWRPNEKYRLDVMGEFYKGNYTENWGINRVTQDLIDNGRYLPNDQTDAQYFRHIAQLGNGQISNAGNLPPRTGDGLPASWAVNAIAPFAPAPPDAPFPAAGIHTITPLDPNNTVPVDRTWKLSAPGDDSNATVFWAQAIQEFTPSEEFKLINNTYFHYKDRHTFSSYHYSELQRDNWSIENRLQAIQEFELETFDKVTLNYGVRFRYQDVWAVNAYFNEPVNFFDLSRGYGNNNNRITDAAFAGNNYVRDQEPRGILTRWYAFGDGDSSSGQDTQTLIVAPFFQADMKLNEQFAVLFGGTIDYVNHDQQIPEEIVSPAGAPLADYFKRNVHNEFSNVNVSFVYKPRENMSVYATANIGENYLAANGGSIDHESVTEPSDMELLELGFNGSFVDDKVYVGAALFKQTYDDRDLTGQVTTTETTGFEVEVNYQPNRNFFATIGYSWLDAEKTFPAGSTPMASVYTASRVGETAGYYVTPSFVTGGIASEQTFEAAGVPEHLLNGLVQYKFDNGIGVQANIVVWGEMNSGYSGYQQRVFNPADPTPYDFTGPVAGGSRATDYILTADTARAPIQFEIDAKIFYEYENWLFELSAFNITDEENWDFNNELYANGSALARAETNYQFRVSYEW